MPRGNVSDEYLEAVGSTRVGYLGANQQQTLSLGLNTTFEAKLRPKNDTIPEEQWQKIKLLTLAFSSLGWDFERAKVTKKTGLTNRRSALPRDPTSCRASTLASTGRCSRATRSPTPPSSSRTAPPCADRFRSVRRRPSFVGSRDCSGMQVARLDHRRRAGIDADVHEPDGRVDDGLRRRAADCRFDEPARGADGRSAGRGWEWSLTYSAQRTRPPTGSGVVIVDPTPTASRTSRTSCCTSSACSAGRTRATTVAPASRPPVVARTS